MGGWVDPKRRFHAAMEEVRRSQVETGRLRRMKFAMLVTTAIAQVKE